MKFATTLTILLLGIALYSFHLPNEKDTEAHQNNLLVTSMQLDGNRISTWFRTNGSFNRDPSTSNAGFEWPKGTGKYARYASGIWIGCVQGNDTLTAVAEFSYDYLPGYVDDSGNPQGLYDDRYKVYKIIEGNETDPDYLNWPRYQGAYVTPAGRPLLMGNQTMFYSYTDAYPHASGSTSIQSLKAQILQTNWCSNETEYKDMMFTEFRIINRSDEEWTNLYLGFWTDDDVGSGEDDAIGYDSLRYLGYTYNFTNNDALYGTAPPAVGTVMLKPPYDYTGNNIDTVKYYDPPGTQNIRIKVGYKFINDVIYNTYNNVSPQPSDPNNNTETFRVLSGYWRNGNPWIIPGTSQVSKKVYSGDPVSGAGWIMTDGSDRRSLQSFGPFSMNVNDTQSILIAQVIARGTSNKNSITLLRAMAEAARFTYITNFPGFVSIKNISNEVPEHFILKQNYPNPFNPVTNLEFGITRTSFVRLIVYDVLGKEVVTIVNEKKTPGMYRAEFDAYSNNGSRLSSGIYYYKLEIDGKLAGTKRMVLLK